MKNNNFFILVISIFFLIRPCQAEELDQSTQFPSLTVASIRQQDIGEVAPSKESPLLRRWYSPYASAVTERAALLFYITSLINPDLGTISVGLTCLNICQRLYRAHTEGRLPFTDYTMKLQSVLKRSLGRGHNL
jgi:hypothetical protein